MVQTLRTCPGGHQYYKSSSCPVCPVCEKERSGAASWLDVLAAPARRALENHGITTPVQLSSYSSKELLNLHGIGPASIPILKAVLESAGLTFKP